MDESLKRQIYLDHGATTPVRPEVFEVMVPFWTEAYGNPSSVHQYGRHAKRALESARESIARSLNCKAEEIIFTGCGSESDNLAIRGTMWAARLSGRGNHLITCSIEHKAVLETASQLRELNGFEVTVIGVDEHGQVDLEDIKNAIRPDTALVTIMAANNEIGTFQPIDQIGSLAHNHDILFHSDAIQSIAVSEWDLTNQPIDFLSIAPHKFYGPKGVGILYAREGTKLVSSLTGGGQEVGYRAGTENVAYAVGAAKALELAVSEQKENIGHYWLLTDLLINGLLSALPDDCRLTGHPTERQPNNASFAFKNISGNDLVFHLDLAGICASSGSACLTGNPKPARVLEAIGLDEEWTRGGLRLTVGRKNTLDDVDYTLAIIPDIVTKMRQLNAQFA